MFRLKYLAVARRIILALTLAYWLARPVPPLLDNGCLKFQFAASLTYLFRFSIHFWSNAKRIEPILFSVAGLMNLGKRVFSSRPHMSHS